MISLFPTRIGNIRVRIEDTRVRYMKITSRDKNDEPWSAAWQSAPSLTNRDRDQLIQLIQNDGFLNLPTALIDEMAVDGFREEVEVIFGEVRHQVMLQNTKSEVFNKVKQAITRLIPFQ